MDSQMQQAGSTQMDDQTAEEQLKSLLEGKDILNFQKVHQDAIIPYRATSGSAGYDVYSRNEEITLCANGQIKIYTGIRVVKFPEGCYGRLACSSGWAFANKLYIPSGVIDPDYEGEIIVPLCTTSNTDLLIEPNRRVAQLVIERISTPPVYETLANGEMVRNKNDLYLNRAPKRGAGGFGSTKQTATIIDDITTNPPNEKEEGELADDFLNITTDDDYINFLGADDEEQEKEIDLQKERNEEIVEPRCREEYRQEDRYYARQYEPQKYNSRSREQWYQDEYEYNLPQYLPYGRNTNKFFVAGGRPKPYTYDPRRPRKNRCRQ